MRFSAIIALAILCLPAVESGATTLAVDVDGAGEYLTIQEGIDAAAGGDTVLVLAGIYTGPLNRDIDFAGRAIVLASMSGPDATVIDCEREGRGFHFHSGEGADALVRGFTVTGGVAEGGGPPLVNGGGVLCDEASPRFLECAFVGNSDRAAGLSRSDASFTECVFVDNSGSLGGAVRCYLGTPAFTNCTFVGNQSTSSGGAICAERAAITNCTFVGNEASDGSALYLPSTCGVTVTNTIFAFNRGGTVVDGNWFEDVNNDYCAPVFIRCCSFGNDTGDALVGEWDGTMYLDPAFCDTTTMDLQLQGDSPCLPENNPWGELLGAHAEGCAGAFLGEWSCLIDGVVRRGEVDPLVVLELDRRREVGVEIYDLRGRLVRSLVSAERMSAGMQFISWDLRDDDGTASQSGTYFCVVEIDGKPVKRTVALMAE